MIKYKYSKMYWFFRDLEWMKVYFSPFKFFLPKLYIGKVNIGTPYFLPRRLVKATPERTHKATEEFIKKQESFNSRNPKYVLTIKSYDEIYKEKIKCSFFEPKIIGFDFVSLGFKTKWSNTDFRHEWNPVWSFVCFGYQLALIFAPEDYCHYWESYLHFNYATDKTKSWRDRLEYVRKEFPNTWTSHSDKGKITTNYWDVCIKSKYLKKSKQQIRDSKIEEILN